MKLKTVILAFYLLALAVYPCSDGYTCEAPGSTEQLEKVELAQHNHSEDAGDQCSPFCICACCSVTVRLTVYQVTLTESTHHTLHTIPYRQRPLLSNTHAIWQPPKLG